MDVIAWHEAVQGSKASRNARAIRVLPGSIEYRMALENAGFGGFRILLFQQEHGVKAASGNPGLKFSVDIGG